MRMNKLFIFLCGVFLALTSLVAVFAPVLAPEDPNRINVRGRLQEPNMQTALLGRDHLGRDLLSRLIYGARISLLVGASAAVLSAIGGTVIGLFGGYSRGPGGAVLMRLVDTIMSFPPTLLALALMAVLGQRVENIIIALAVTYVPRVARVVHASAVQLRELDYVTSAVAVGAGGFRVIFRHILPNAIGPLFVQTSFIFAYAVLSESGLSFIGVGVPAGTPSWGSMLADGRSYLLSAPWIMMYPGFAIFALVLSLNVIGDALRDKLDPKLTLER